MLNIRLSRDRLIFNMGILIYKDGLYIVMGPMSDQHCKHMVGGLGHISVTNHFTRISTSIIEQKFICFFIMGTIL